MINKEKAVEYLEGCNSKTDFAAKLGYSCYNGTVGDKSDKIFEKYNLNPEFDRGKANRKYERVEKECPVCEETFIAKKGHPRERETCSHSCSNSHFKHGNSEEAKKKKSESLREYYQENGHPLANLSLEEKFEKFSSKDVKCDIHSYKNCNGCGKLFVRANAKGNSERKTCSKGCKVKAQVGERNYQNGSRNPEYYENPNTGENVLLESSWEVEVAEKLDELKIEWERPDPVIWNDSKDEPHYYYPDFFLPNYDLYLDPKNPYCMNRDEEKMKKVSQKLDIEFGSLEKVISVINKLEN